MDIPSSASNLTIEELHTLLRTTTMENQNLRQSLQEKAESEFNMSLQMATIEAEIKQAANKEVKRLESQLAFQKNDLVSLNTENQKILSELNESKEQQQKLLQQQQQQEEIDALGLGLVQQQQQQQQQQLVTSQVSPDGNPDTTTNPVLTHKGNSSSSSSNNNNLTTTPLPVPPQFKLGDSTSQKIKALLPQLQLLSEYLR